MAEPTPPPKKAPKPQRVRLSLSEMLTIDDLINFVMVKAHSRRGRLVLTGATVVLAAGIVVGPLLTRSSSAAGPDTTPTTVPVTDPPTTLGLTTHVKPILPIIDVGKTDGHRYGQKPTTTTVAPPRTTPTTAAPTPTTAAPAVQPTKPAPTPQTAPPPPPPLTIPGNDTGVTVPTN
jgi:hypothetical protein